MKKENVECDCQKTVVKKCHGHGESSAIYGLGVVGALFYFLQGAVTFTAIVVGIGKALFWPAFVVFKVLQLLSL